MQTNRVVVLTCLLSMPAMALAASSPLPSEILVANNKLGHILVSCQAASGGPGTWIEQQPGTAQRDGYLFRPLEKNDMPGDELYLACDGLGGQAGTVKTDGAPMPPQFIVKKNDEVDAGKFMVVAVESAPRADSFQSMTFIVATYAGDSLVTTKDATIVIDGTSRNAQVFRSPLVTRIVRMKKGFGIHHDVAASTPSTCAITYFDGQFEKKSLVAAASCADLAKVAGWPAVADGNIPSALLQALGP